MRRFTCEPGELRLARRPAGSYEGEAADDERHGSWAGTVLVGNISKIGNRSPARRMHATWRADVVRMEIASDEPVIW